MLQLNPSKVAPKSELKKELQYNVGINGKNNNKKKSNNATIHNKTRFQYDKSGGYQKSLTVFIMPYFKEYIQ